MAEHLCTSKLKYMRKGKYRNNKEEEEGKKEGKGR
jgi:hypothetical protein